MIDTIGIEVELSVWKLKHPVVCDFLPYTKEAPLDKKGTLYHKDASMFELAMRPCTSGEELDTVYSEALSEATGMLPDETELVCLPSAEYSNEELGKDAYASVLGCGASRNLYGYCPMPDGYTDNKRYAGLHVNIGLADDDLRPTDVLSLDATLGLVSVLHLEQPYKEEIQARRTVYGRAGEYRMKPFGLEYRTLPASSWVGLGGRKLWQLTARALRLSFVDIAPLAKDIQRCIDTCNAPLAEELIHAVHGGERLI